MCRDVAHRRHRHCHLEPVEILRYLCFYALGLSFLGYKLVLVGLVKSLTRDLQPTLFEPLEHNLNFVVQE